jgi:ketosteroid isomerase-like protein
VSAREVLKKYEMEINKNNFSLLAPLISSECKFWFSSGAYSGLEETRKAFEKTWKLIKEETYWLTDVEWISEADRSAVCTYTFHWKGIINGVPCEGKGRGTSCFRKEGEDWKIIHEHLSHFPKAINE